MMRKMMMQKPYEIDEVYSVTGFSDLFCHCFYGGRDDPDNPLGT